MKRIRRGSTLLEAAVATTCAAVLFGAAAAVLDNPQRSPDSVRDGAQLGTISNAMIIFASINRGRYPVPGLIRRLPAEIAPDRPPIRIPGVGPEDVTQNTTANLYAALIAQEYFNPDLVISPLEPNPRVEMISDYDYRQYNPGEASYWDRAFKADLAEQSHTSYAHLVLHGKRKVRKWRDTSNPEDAILSNRGPKDGQPNPDSYWCDPHGLWSGNVVTGDNSVQFLRSPASDAFTITVDGAKRPDNLFAFDVGIDGADLVLTFTRAIDEGDGPTVQFD